MNRTLRILSIVFSCVAMGTAGLYLGYGFMNDEDEAKRKPNPAFGEDYTVSQEPEEKKEEPASVLDSQKPEEAFITADTMLVYEYIYRETGKIQQSAEAAPYHMLYKTQRELEDMLTDWEITGFSQDEVTLRKVIHGGGGQKYTVGVQDGYVAVFYQQSVDGSKLKEVTDTPLSALPEDEQLRLSDGILISGDDELMRVLEDYSS